MKAIVMHKYGDSAELGYENIEKPAINKDQLLVKIMAASVNHLEIKKASGGMKKDMPVDFPWIPGHDFSGIIEDVGENIKDFKKGDEVYGNCNGGSYAEYLAANPATTVLKSQKTSFIEAASIPHVAETAWQGIFTHGELKSGQNVLIHGAAGAVGGFAVQFAKSAGATVYANSSGKDKEYLKSIGADIIIDYRTEDFTTIARDIDLVFDLVEGETQKRSYQVMKKKGILITTVSMNTGEVARKYGITAKRMIINQSGEDLKKITGLIDSGKLKWDVELILPLEDAKKGWDILQGKDDSLKISHGKIVLETNQ